jgi:hypothetical protein
LNYQGTFQQRQKEAKEIIYQMMIEHGKAELLRYVANLAQIEYNAKRLQPYARDHVVHALLSFLLGVYLNEKLLKQKNFGSANSFELKLAGLFHDIGYPVQIANNAILEPFKRGIIEIRRKLNSAAPIINFRIVPEGLERLSNCFNALDLIQDRLESWDLAIDAHKEYNKMITSGNICHGIISSLAVMNVVDLLYQKKNPERKHKDIHVGSANFNQKYFEEDVVSACTAIYIHNLPSDAFHGTKIDRTKAPLAFLLKLSDSLQEWERPSLINKTGFPSSKFQIGIEYNKLVFRADIPEDSKTKIRDDLSSTLIAPDVEIL